METGESELTDFFGEVLYIIPVEDGSPDEASFLQGFARSLMQNVGIVRLINTLPSNIFELTPEGQSILLPKRMSGQGSITWYGQSPKALTSFVTPVFVPFMVLFLGHDHKIQTYEHWISSHTFPLVVVAKEGGTINYDEFTIDRLRECFLKICDALEGQVNADALINARQCLNNWVEPKERKLGYQVGGHNSIHPNVLALQAAGFRNMLYGPFKDIGKGIGPYVDQIVKTTRSILDERNRIGIRQINQYIKRPPSINLFAPSIYPHFNKLSLTGADLPTAQRRKFETVRRILERQKGYSLTAKTRAQHEAFLGLDDTGEPHLHFLVQERAAELKLSTECIGTLAASEISAVIRLPNAVNRTKGQVRQFTQQYNARRTTERKRIEGFRRVQSSITGSVPQEFFEFIEAADEGIRLVSDAHLEWMNIRGLPLCIQKDVSRIPVTPGNLFVDQISHKEHHHLKQSDFNEVLILSALQEDDPISPLFDNAINTFAPLIADRIKVRTERVRNEEDFVRALNSFEGAMMIFDGHGGHEPGEPAKLRLIEEEIDIWQLQTSPPRIPPIVILSACDTHAADRNHASTANGFLSLGARAVLGSVFPIDAMDASSFVARLLYRIAEYVPSAHKLFNRSLSWMEIMAGMIRMQLLTDFCRRLEQKGFINHEAYREIHINGNAAINGGKLWPFEVVISDLTKYGLDEKLASRELNAATVNSTAISYLHLGRPETIIVHPEEEFPNEGFIR